MTLQEMSFDDANLVSHSTAIGIDRKRDVGFLNLSEENRKAMARIAASVSDPYADYALATAEGLAAVTRMDPDKIKVIQDFATNPAAPSALVVTGLPADQTLPPTPGDGERAPQRKSYVGETITLGMGALIGQPVGYETEKQGELLHNLIPIKGAETTQSNRGSSTFLRFHNDSVYDESGVFHRYNPDFLVLYGHRADPGRTAKTLYMSARTLIGHLPDAIVAQLKKPEFRMAAPANFTDLLNEGDKVWSMAMPVITGTADAPEIAIAANGVEGMNPDARAAIDMLYEVCQDPQLHAEVLVECGTMLLINNRKGLHARSAFVANYGPDERWLLRANIRRDTWALRHRMTSRHMVFR